jgi:chemotaxis protein methyltransferase CheR
MNFEAQLSLKLSLDEFDYFRSKIHSLAGISLSNAKLDLIQARLRSRVHHLGLGDFRSYRNHLENLPSSDPEWELFINVLTTNKTDWFREDEHFRFITQKFLPQWLKLGRKHLSVWCAASSTGEEPYTLSLVLNQALKQTGISYKILATDIDTKVLSIAKNGVYPKDRLSQIPPNYHAEFVPGTKDISAWMKVRKCIKKKVEFRQLNLNHSPYELNEKFDLILCRNVLIYFNPETIAKVTQGLHACATKDAVLLIAHSESLQNITSSWKFVRPSIYQKGKLL